MKKKLLFALVMFLVTLSSSIAYSQVSKSILDTTKIWSNIITIGGDQTSVAYTIVYKMGDDTIVDNLVYKKVMATDYFESDTTLTNYELRFIVREDSNIVYVRIYNNFYDQLSDEFIAYNFNLNTGDTITLPVVIGGQINLENNLYRVDSVDNVLINSTSLKRIYIYNTMFDITEEWIEGIGSSHGLFESGFKIDWGGSRLGCVWQSGDLLYGSGDCLIYYGIDDVLTNEEIKLYPTIVKDNVCIETRLENYNIIIYDIYGRIALRRKNINSVIDLSSLRNGVYQFFVLNKENKPLKIQKIIKIN